ncbi:hypothetical protein AB0D78_40265 [Streptomyces avermitilis]|uniref:hypothetical protein n=1 Tax=Streptomyces avermitilis TaxID=33903 RepID=UPI0033FE8DE2
MKLGRLAETDTVQPRGADMDATSLPLHGHDDVPGRDDNDRAVLGVRVSRAGEP